MNADRCPRCDAEQLKTWAELKDDEREVVDRLPNSATYGTAERRNRHRWCTRCWYEEKKAPDRSA